MSTSRFSLPLLSTCLILSLAPANAWAQLSFAPAQNYPGGGDLQFVALADLNGDGKLDVAVADQNGGVGILLGNGDGTLQPVVTYDLALPADSLAIADLNGDGKLDIALAGSNGGFDVLLGNGDGTFRSPVHYAGGARIMSLVVVDFNGDAKLDVALADQGLFPDCGGVKIFLNNGDGTFGGPATNRLECGPVGLAVGDFNGDDKADLAITAVADTEVGIMLGNGDGSFQPFQLVALTSFPMGVIAVDLNDSGHDDIITANSGSLDLSIFIGHGNGTFTNLGTLATGFNPNSVVAANFGNGRLDLAAANDGFGGFPNNVSVLMRGPLGFLPQQTFATDVGPYWIAAGDLNGDGKIDIVTANVVGTVTVLLNTSH